jgi:multiple sugar transport system ATP-binding protein
MRVTVENVSKRYGDLTAVDDLSLDIRDGEFVTLVGPSGCGKTTTLRMIAGLEIPDEGRITFGDRDVTDLPAQKRDIAFVFQGYALYPHMTARRNMTFALEDEGLPSDEVSRKVDDAAEMLGIHEHMDKRPGQLSGGQQQRVALGRSIVRDPKIFLLDEPLSNLDAKLRIQMRAELQKLHRRLETTMVYVTHDQEEAMTMSDRIIVLNGGRLQQVSKPEVAYHRPRNRFVAEFIGSPSMNFLPCDRAGDRLTAGPFGLDAPADLAREPVELGVRPEDVLLDAGGQVTGHVEVFERVGSFNIVYLAVEGYDEEVVAQVAGDSHFQVGSTVDVSVREDRIHLFDEDGESVHNPPLTEATEAPYAAGEARSDGGDAGRRGDGDARRG